MKNIGIDARCLMEENLTGVGEYTYNLLKNLFEIDGENQYFLFFNKKRPFLGHVDKLKNHNVSLCEFNYPNKLLNFCLYFFNRPYLDSLIQKKYGKNIDLFFFPNINFLSVSPICKYIITAHDLTYEIFPYFFCLKRRLWHNAVNSKKIFHAADKIISVSENTKNDLINLYNTNPNKIKTVHSGTKINNCSKSAEQIKQTYNLPKYFILSLGTLEPRKNIETLIEAFARLKAKTDLPHQLVIAGDKGWKYENIFKLAEKLNIKNQVIFPGYVKSEDKQLIYELADLFVYPSYYEGFGFPPLEAMACKTPVICSHTSSLTEICENTAIFIDPYNVNELSWAMERVLTDSNLKSNLIGKGFVQSQKFGWKETAKKILDIFTD
jgi:glycosyltransferase involved in cell wall biosynthesis